MTDFSELNLGIDGDSITAGEQWSFHVYKNLGMKSHSNVAVGSSVWYKRTFEAAGKTVTTQDYGAADFAGISDGWEPTDDPLEMQKAREQLRGGAYSALPCGGKERQLPEA